MFCTDEWEEIDSSESSSDEMAVDVQMEDVDGASVRYYITLKLFLVCLTYELYKIGTGLV